MEHKADHKLVARLLKGSETDFHRFYDSYFPRLYRFCITRMPNEHVCQDVVQQTFANAMRGLHTYKGEASLLTWLCQIARNDIAKWYRSHGDEYKKTDSLDQNPELRASLESMESDLYGSSIGDSNKEVQHLVHCALDQLPSSYSEVLELKYIEGLSVIELAQRFSVGEFAMQSLLARARKAFKLAYSQLQPDINGHKPSTQSV